MIKYIVSLSLIGSVICAGELEVKKSDVVISLNGVEKVMKKSERLVLGDGILVCFKSGDGRVIINNRRQLTKKSKKCYQTPLSKGFDIASYIEKAKSKITLATIGDKEKVIHGVSTKAIANLDDGHDIIIENPSDDLVFYSEKFGPHPITMYLKDEKGKELLSFENEDNEITFFQLTSSSIKSGYSIEILNGFDEILLSKKILIKK